MALGVPWDSSGSKLYGASGVGMAVDADCARQSTSSREVTQASFMRAEAF